MTGRAEGQGAVPIRPAATLMLVDDRPDLQVLMLRRRPGSIFVGGMSVFPGGAVDPEDSEAAAVCAGIDDRNASTLLGVERGGLAFWVAAIRETFEESGMLLARRGEADGRELAEPASASRFAVHRAEVDAGRLRLSEVARQEGLKLCTDTLAYVARWITPPGSPRRYDTRFFLALAPPGQTARPDEREAVHAEWVPPREAIAQFEAGRRPMLPPTVGMLRILADYGRSADVLAAARRRECGPDRVARLAHEGEFFRVLLPGDADYDRRCGHEMEGWVRLSPPAADAG